VHASSSTTSASAFEARLALIVFAIDLKKLRSIVGLPLFLERPEGSFMSRMDAGELDVARTGEQPWQAVGGGEHAPASMCISESASDVIESMA
jgi:hypothetical protein